MGNWGNVFLLFGQHYMFANSYSFVPLQLSADTKRIYISRNSQKTEKTLQQQKAIALYFHSNCNCWKLACQMAYISDWSIRSVDVCE